LAGDQIQFSDSSSLAAARAGADTSDIRTYHISAGNQNFYSAPVQGMTTDQINQQLGLIDSMLAATSDPTATQTLQTARAQLQRRLSQATAAPPGPGH
jgi:hypothetical protein